MLWGQMITKSYVFLAWRLFNRQVPSILAGVSLVLKCLSGGKWLIYTMAYGLDLHGLTLSLLISVSKAKPCFLFLMSVSKRNLCMFLGKSTSCRLSSRIWENRFAKSVLFCQKETYLNTTKQIQR